MAVVLSSERFGKRLKALYSSWQDGANWGGATALAIVAGGAAEDIRYWKSSSLHLWLLGYEFTGKYQLLRPFDRPMSRRHRSRAGVSHTTSP